MAQNFPLKEINPSTKTGVQLAQDLVNFSETFRTMMSGSTRPADLEQGLWLRTNTDGSADVVYSHKDPEVDLALFTVAANGGRVQLSTDVRLSSDNVDGDAQLGELNDLTDVVVGMAQEGNLLMRSGSDWIAKAIALGDIDDIAVASAEDGQVLAKTSSGWTAETPVRSIDDLTDVNSADANEGEVLIKEGAEFKAKPLHLTSTDPRPVPVGTWDGTQEVLTRSAAGTDIRAMRVGLGAPDVLIEDRKASGTNGGTAYNGGWHKRDLNTVQIDRIGVSLLDNSFTLPAGNYFFKFLVLFLQLTNVKSGYQMVPRAFWSQNQVMRGSLLKWLQKPQEVVLFP